MLKSETAQEERDAAFYNKGWRDAINAAVDKASMLSRNAEKPRHKIIAAQVAESIAHLKETPCKINQYSGRQSHSR